MDNYFEHFGLDVTYDIDQKQLKSAYRQLQKESHPDRFAHEDVSVQRQAVQQTAMNTERFQTLKSDVHRGSHILHLNQIDFDLASFRVDDIEMLMRQMKYREQLSEIKDNNDYNSLEMFHGEMKQLHKELMTQISDLFKAGIVQNEAKLKATLCELQFFDKLSYECEQVEEHLLMD